MVQIQTIHQLPLVVFDITLAVSVSLNAETDCGGNRTVEKAHLHPIPSGLFCSHGRSRWATLKPNQRKTARRNYSVSQQAHECDTAVQCGTT